MSANNFGAKGIDLKKKLFHVTCREDNGIINH